MALFFVIILSACGSEKAEADSKKETTASRVNGDDSGSRPYAKLDHANVDMALASDIKEKAKKVPYHRLGHTAEGTKIIIEGKAYPINMNNYKDNVGKDDQFKVRDRDGNEYIIKNEDLSYINTHQYKRVRLYGTYEGQEKEIKADPNKQTSTPPRSLPTITAYIIENKPRTAEEIAKDKAIKDRIQKDFKINSVIDEVSEAVHKQFGDKNTFNNEESIIGISYNKDNEISIKVFGRDNPSKNLIKKGMWKDIADTLADLKDHTDINNIAFNIVFPMKGKNGNTSNDIVMKASFDRDTLDQINRDNPPSDNIPNTADDYWEHPSFKKN